MLVWYERIDMYFKKIKKKIKEIEDGKYYNDLPGPLSIKHLSVEYRPHGCYVYHGQETLKTFLYKLQYYAHFNNDPTKIKKTVYYTLGYIWSTNYFSFI